MRRRVARPLMAALVVGIAGAGGPAEAAWPGQDGKISFESDRAGNAEIFIMNVDGSGQTNLTNHPAADRIPSWSPDGTKIAFQSNRNGNFDIYVMNADGGGLTQITSDPAQDANAWWSPDGKRIVFSSSRDRNCPAGTPELRCFEIYVMKADGNEQTRLTFDPGNDGAPAWSPDGDTIAFGRRDNTTFKWDVWVMNPDGTEQTRLTDEPANNPEASRHPDWSPDAAALAFESTRDAPAGNIELYAMSPDGSGQTRLTTTDAPDLHAAWSPDGGERIAFTSRRDGNAEIHVMNADGSEPTRLTFTPGLDNFPDWQPQPAGPVSEWSAPVNLGHTVNSPFNDAAAAISKDGLSLYFSSNRPGGFGGVDIWVSQRASLDDPWGTPANLGAVNTAFDDRAPGFSRDGHVMFFTSNRPGSIGGEDLWFSFREHAQDDFAWQAPAHLGAQVNSVAGDAAPSYLEQGAAEVTELFFNSDRPGGPGGFDIYLATQQADGSFAAAALVAELSSPQGDARPAVRHDGREIFLHSTRPGFGGQDLWVSSRSTLLDPWSRPVNLGATVNTAANEAHPALFARGGMETVIFDSNRVGGLGFGDLYMTTR